MAKNITKQVLIAILIVVAVSLVLAIIFYKFTPSNKVVPAKAQAYKTPENVASEISDEAAEQKYETTNQVFEVTDSDLTNYKNSKSYNPGKSDPFAEYQEEEDNSGNETSTSTTTPSTSTPSSSNSKSTETNNNSNTTKTNTVDENAKDQYYTESGINKGTK